MDNRVRQNMLAYYNERASEYEEAYTAGTGTSSIADGNVFVRENADLVRVVQRFGHGHLLDVACGTGYWLPHYAGRCARITLVDQAANMLREAAAKVEALGVASRCDMIQADVLMHDFPPAAYDCALVAFLISHLSDEEERALFATLRRALVSGGRVLILESAWTDLRARFNPKAATQPRRLNDGTSFVVFKKYLDRADIAGWAATHGLLTEVEFFGDALFAVSGVFER